MKRYELQGNDGPTALLIAFSHPDLIRLRGGQAFPIEIPESVTSLCICAVADDAEGEAMVRSIAAEHGIPVAHERQGSRTLA